MDRASASALWVFPVSTAGPRSYMLTTLQFATGGPSGLYYPVITAQYIPFGSDVSPTSLGQPEANIIAAGARTGGPAGTV